MVVWFCELVPQNSLQERYKNRLVLKYFLIRSTLICCKYQEQRSGQFIVRPIKSGTLFIIYSLQAFNSTPETKSSLQISVTIFSGLPTERFNFNNCIHIEPLLWSPPIKETKPLRKKGQMNSLVPLIEVPWFFLFCFCFCLSFFMEFSFTKYLHTVESVNTDPVNTCDTFSSRKVPCNHERIEYPGTKENSSMMTLVY